METEIEELLKKYKEVFERTREEVFGRRFKGISPGKVVNVQGKPVIIIGALHMTGTFFKKPRGKMPKLIRALQQVVRTLKEQGFQIMLEGPTGPYLIPRDKFFAGQIHSLEGLSEEEKDIARREFPTLRDVSHLWWRETYGAFDAVGKVVGDVHTIPYDGKYGLPEIVNPRYVAAIRKLAERGPVALIIGADHVDDIAKKLEEGHPGEETEVHRILWHGKERRWKLVEKL